MTEEEDRLRHEQYSIARAAKEIQLLRDDPIQFFSEEPEKFIKHVLMKIRQHEQRLDTIEQFLQTRFPAFTPSIDKI